MENYNELYHAGIKGMKWGVRRYQNKDGTLTDAGKKRYARDAREKEFDQYDKEKNVYYKESKKNGRSDLTADPDRYVKEDLERSKRVADSTANFTRELKNANDRAIRNTPKKRMDLSKMTDKEMREQINRELLERQYNDVFNPPTVSKGRRYASKILEGAGTTITLVGGALGIAVAIKDLRTKSSS